MRPRLIKLAGLLAALILVGGSNLFGAYGVSAATTSPGGVSGVSASGNVTAAGNSLSASFTVSFTSTAAAQGYVLFGAGPGCAGLVNTATIDQGAGTTQHTITVSGNDMPGTVGNIGLVPGTTYSYEVVTVGAAGTQTDNNGGQCYSVTVPATPAGAGLLYTMTNSPAGNNVLAFTTNADGTLTPAGTYPTGGVGFGAHTESQGALTLSRDGHFLFAVNAGDNTVSSFVVTPNGLKLASHVSSGGVFPKSVTEANHIVYVANGGNTQKLGPLGTVDAVGNISGFRVDANGVLTPIPNSSQPTGNGDRDIVFDPTGTKLVVSNDTSNDLLTYAVDPRTGVAGAPVRSPSADPFPFGPFGIAFDPAGHLIVSDVNSSPDFSINNPAGASSYAQGPNGTLKPVTAFAPALQAAACWVVIDKGYAYVTNAAGVTPSGPGSISSYRIGGDGSLTLIAGAAANVPGQTVDPATGQAHFAFDEALGRNGAYL